MKPMITPCALLSLLTVAAMAAEPVFLVDEDDTRHGPFELRAKTELPLRGHVYRVEGLPDEAKELVALLKATKLSPFQFNEARLPELVQFVRENAAKQNPRLAGIGFLIVDGLPEDKPQDPDPPAGDAAAAPGAPPAPPAAAVPEPPEATVSFQAEGMSVWDFLTTAAKLSGYRLDVDAKVAQLLHPRIPDGPLVERVYAVGRLFTSPYGCTFQTERKPPDYPAMLSQFGIRWPQGASIRSMPERGELLVVNTPENHRRLAEFIKKYKVNFKQVEIDCQFVALPRGAVEKVARSGRVPSSAVLELVRDGQGTLLACPKVVTKNGSEATIKGVVEMIYPTEFTVGGSGSATNAPPNAGGTAVEPGGFETREVGVILQVVPDVTPDGNLINLTLAPQVVYPPEWKDYAARVTDGRDKEALRPAPMPQPFFPVDSITTSVQIYNGSTIVIGGGAPSKDGKTFTYMLISATMVDAAGAEVVTADDTDTWEPVETLFE
jgi:hypothetical protein